MNQYNNDVAKEIRNHLNINCLNCRLAEQHRVSQMLDLCTVNVDLDKPISRVFQAKYFLSDFEKNQLTIAAVSKWKDIDPYEAAVLRQDGMYNGTPTSLEGILARVFAQCWTTNPDESEAAWRVYAHSSGWDLVRVTTTPRKLMSALISQIPLAEIKLALGKVDYGDDVYPDKMEFFNLGNAVAWGQHFLFKKRRAFRYEDEVRLIYFCSEPEEHPGCNPSLKLGRSASLVFDEVLFSPKMCECQFAYYKEKLKKAGFSGKISKSELYKTPQWRVKVFTNNEDSLNVGTECTKAGIDSEVKAKYQAQTDLPPEDDVALRNAVSKDNPPDVDSSIFESSPNL